LVEKRTLVFVVLAATIWAASASAFAGYYSLQNSINIEQLGSTQNSLNEIASNYSIVTDKYNLLLSEYALLRSNYSFFTSSDYAILLPPLETLITDLGKNYNALLLMQEDMNKTYGQLMSDYSALLEKGNVTKADFGNMLGGCYDLLSLCALRELSFTLSEATTLSVNVEIDYGNGTMEWHNETQAPAGQTLFGIMQNIAVINYSYYAFTEPGHVLIDSINNVTTYTDPSYASGYSWIWYYYRDSNKMWLNGPVGCDAWLLKNDGVYRWSYESWSYP
jgi:hypothetical protein